MRSARLFSTEGILHFIACLPHHTPRPLVLGQTPSLPSLHLDADHTICFHSQPRLAELPNCPLPCQIHTFSSQREAEAEDYSSHKTKSLYYIPVEGCLKPLCLREGSPCPALGCVRGCSANDGSHRPPASRPSCSWDLIQQNLCTSSVLAQFLDWKVGYEAEFPWPCCIRRYLNAFRNNPALAYHPSLINCTSPQPAASLSCDRGLLHRIGYLMQVY